MQNIGSGRSESGLVAEAARGEAEHGGGFLAVKVGSEAWVQQVQGQVMMMRCDDDDVLNGTQEVPGAGTEGLGASEEVENDDTEGVDVVLLGRNASPQIVRICVSWRTHHHGPIPLVTNGSREAHVGGAKITEMGIEIGVQKDVGGFDVAVNNRKRFVVKVFQGLGQLVRYCHSVGPWNY